MAFGVTQHGGGIGGGSLAGTRDLREPFELYAGGVVVGLAGAGQVRHQTDRARMPRQRLQPCQAGFRLFRVDAEPAHAGVDLQPELGAHAGDFGLLQQGDLFIVMDDQAQVLFDCRFQFFWLAGSMHHDDRILDATVAQFEGFVQSRDCESIRFPSKRLGAGESPVSIGIGLDDGHQRTVGGLRSRLPAVVNQIGEGDSDPGGPVHEE